MCLYQVVKILDKQLANDYLLPPGRIPMTKESTARQKEWRDMKIMELDSQFKSGKQHISHTLVGTVIKKQRQLAKEHMNVYINEYLPSEMSRYYHLTSPQLFRLPISNSTPAGSRKYTE
jgi:hypothetical protein